MLRNQGFEKSLNLGESDDDRQILNNLAGGNIQLDIALFRNNKRNTSTLIWQYNTNDSSIVNNKFIFPTTVQFVFTNGDEVKVTGSSLGNLNTSTTYYVVGLELNLGELKNQSAFALSLTKGGNPIALGSITSDISFIRRDEVDQGNILNIAKPETQVNDQSLESASAFTYDIGDTFGSTFTQIDSNINNANFTRSQKYATNQSIATDRQISIEGSLVISDPANTNTTAANLLRAKSPGVYVTDPFSSTIDINKTRAYSSNSQPWKEESDRLSTKSSQVNIGDLYFENGIKIDDFDGLIDQSGIINSATNGFTHKLPVKINDVEYFILVRKV